MAYENKSNWTLGENKPNTKPNKANLLDAQMNITSVLTKDYERNDIFAVPENKANSNPTCRGVAPAASPPRRGEAGSNPISKAKKM